MKYYAIQLIVEVLEGQYKDWSEQSDTLSIPAEFHDPESGVYAVGYNETTKMALEINKFNLFDEFGGI